MNDNCVDCPLAPRVEALEEVNRQHSATHREMFDRLRTLETLSAVQELRDKPGKRWESLVEKTIWAVCAAVIAFLLGRVGL